MGLGPHGDRQFSTASAPRRHVTVRSRCGRSPVRSRLTSAWKLSGQPLSVGPVIRPSPASHATPFPRSYRWSRNPSTVERWACGECAFGAAGCVAFGSGSMCRWRRSAVVRIPAFRGWRSRWSKRCDTRSERHSQRSERRNASSAEAAGGASAANVASSMVPNYRGGQIVAGLSQAARDGARQRGSILDYRCR